MEQKILERVQKLMAKAMDSSCTEAEAKAFLDKAKALMEEHGITDDDLSKIKQEDWRDYEYQSRKTKHGWVYHPVWRHCGATIAKFCGCLMYEDGKLSHYNKPTANGARLVLWGLDSDVELAKAILIALSQQYDDNWRRFVYVDRERRGLMAAKEQRGSFTYGFAKELYGKLKPYFREGQSPSGGDTSNALVLRKQELARQALKDIKGLHLRQGGSSGNWGQIDPSAAGAGAMAAKGANVGGAGVGNRTLAIGKG